PWPSRTLRATHRPPAPPPAWGGGARPPPPPRATSRTDRRLPYRAFMVTQYAVHIAVLATLLIAGVH
ncbi:hypothetical protein, partial [Nocardia brasiliensis]|uniref:hypothetical protein n=1 Tax=Nocardia brasiliensis TaxID=37326 RepID=UPI0024547BF1